jgi:hypothetical protein
MNAKEAIESALAKYPKAKTTPVWNFVGTATDNGRDNALNLNMDAKLYGWKKDTIEAIKFGLMQLNKW